MTETMREETVEELAGGHWEAGRLVDVRSAEDYAAGHVPGAINVPLDDVVADPAQFGAGEVHFICQSGRRSLTAAEAVGAAGTPAISVSGGTSAWIEGGRQVER